MDQQLVYNKEQEDKIPGFHGAYILFEKEDGKDKNRLL